MKILQHKPYVLLFILGGFFITNAIVAEFIGVKIFSLEALFGISPFNFKLFGTEGLGFNLTAGVLLWPVVFVMTDIINEYFGPRVVKFLSWLTVGLIVYAFLMIYGAISLPANAWWQYESGAGKNITDMDLSYRAIMGQGLWIIVGSMVAFLLGQLVDVLTFHKIKQITGEKSIWLRATGSTLVSQFIDSFVVLFIAFYIGADWSFGRVMAIAIVNYIYKFSMAILLTPVIYLVHGLVEKYLGHEMATRLKTEAMGE